MKSLVERTIPAHGEHHGHSNRIYPLRDHPVPSHGGVLNDSNEEDANPNRTIEEDAHPDCAGSARLGGAEL